MKRIVVAVVSVVAVGVGGCAKRVPPLPADTFVSLGGKQVLFRSWAQLEDLCAINPQQFTDEQQALTTALAEWLGQTSAPADGAWDDEHLALLEAGARDLPPALLAQERALAAAQSARCEFSGLGPSRELNEQASRRLAEAPELIEQVRARLALAKWKELRPAAQQQAKEQQCSTKREPPVPILYFAAEDEAAKMEWLFCDGSKVVASPGNPPQWTRDPAAKKTKVEPEPRTWLDVASRYPPENISRAPKLPKKKRAVRNDAPEPEDQL